MNHSIIRKKITLLFILLTGSLLFASCSKIQKKEAPWTRTATFAGVGGEFGEPFGLAVKDGILYVSDGEQGKILRVGKDGKTEIITDKLNTPSAIAFDKTGDLIVADSGSQTIKKINIQNGEVTIVAGTENKKGYADGASEQSLFNAPIGVAVAENKIYVADTYNDKIRVIENGVVSTVAGSEQGFADGENGLQAKFDTPTGITIAQDGGLIIADLGNRRLRRVQTNGKTTTIAGSGEQDSIDGLLSDAAFVAPTAVAIDKSGAIYVADGNSIRAAGRRFFPFVETITGTKRGYTDETLRASRFNRPSGLAFDEKGNLFIADSENQIIRVISGLETGAQITSEQLEKLRYTPEEFRALQPPRWCYNPPDAKRDIAGTLGEIRGTIAEGKSAWFHNGLDIAGNYGETARFVRAEKVLRPLAVENFDSLRELIRMPTMGYIHIRLGRDENNKTFADDRFQFALDESGKIKSLRVPRGASFEAGEAIGTLNRMNHVHLIAGRAGAEMNALDALVFPNISDTVAPTIEKVYLTDENWREIETEGANQRIKLNGKTRIIVRAFDQMNGNASYRKLGAYCLGYQILREDKTPLAEPNWTISFARLPDEDAVKVIYAPGSQSGYTPQTIFDYVVTNEVYDDIVKENFFDAGGLETGNYILRVLAADFFGNNIKKDLKIEIFR